MLRRPTIFYSYFELYNRAGKNSRIISNKKEQTVYWYTQQPGWISRTLPLVKSINLQRLGTIWYPLYNTSKSRDDELSRCCLGTRMQEHGGRGGGSGKVWEGLARWAARGSLFVEPEQFCFLTMLVVLWIHTRIQQHRSPSTHTHSTCAQKLVETEQGQQSSSLV